MHGESADRLFEVGPGQQQEDAHRDRHEPGHHLPELGRTREIRARRTDLSTKLSRDPVKEAVLRHVNGSTV